MPRISSIKRSPSEIGNQNFIEKLEKLQRSVCQEKIPSKIAASWTEGHLGKDVRPRFLEGLSKKFCLVDSGSAITAVAAGPHDKPDPKLFLQAVNGSKIPCYGYKDISVRIGRKTYNFKAIKANVQATILGWDFIRHFKLDLVWNDFGDITIYDKKAKTSSLLSFKSIPSQKSDNHKSLSVLNTVKYTRSKEDTLKLIHQVAAMQELSVVKEDIESVPEGPYKDLLSKYPRILEQNFSEKTESNITHRIKIKEGEKPCRAKVRRLLPGSEKEKKAKEAWFQLIELGIVERVDPSQSNIYTSPVHFVPKPDGSLRPTGDFRSLNLKTELDLFPLPHLRDFSYKLAGAKVFSKVDLFKAFHQIEIDPRDRHYTTVTTPWGLFQFRRLAMGLQNSAQAFQRYLQDVLADVEDVFIYLDDLLIFSRNQEEHLATLESIFAKLAAAGLSISLGKCVFGQDSVEYLGYKVDAAGITPMAKKVEALAKFPAPTKQKELLAFLGALNYYRASLPNLTPEESAEPAAKARAPADVLDPLYKLATCKLEKKKGHQFQDIWESSSKVKNAFTDAKTLLSKAITLNYPIPGAPLALSTDASQSCLGASLDQFVDGHWRPLGLWSKSLSPAQQRYSTYLRELLAIKHAIRHFIHDINGRVLTVFTDHKPLIGTWKNPDLQAHDSVAMNAINEIAQWTCDIRYKPGKDLLVPDMLSRPFGTPSAYKVDPEDAPDYIPPEATMAALQEVALNVVSPSALAEAQKSCPDVANHRKGCKPKDAAMADIDISGHTLYCEVSDESNPRPLVPETQRNIILNLLHHQDHPSAQETLRRAAGDYYWPRMKKDVEGFVRTCHPCQAGKQSKTVNPGTSAFPVPDQRFSTIHLDVVGPLPESEGARYLLSILDRTSRWIECYPMSHASSSECCKAFMEWASRYGLPSLALSDNGNTFIANLYKDIMDTFNVKVSFVPAYHPATNGAVERRHQTIKNALKASLIDMGNTHGDKWMRALPWVMLGKRIQVQPDLDTSAASLVFGKELRIPGQLLGHPGKPLTNLQTKALLEELYKLSAKPAQPTSALVEPIDISYTERATHVYIKVEDPAPLCPRFEGPYKITSRPSRSTVEVRLGSYVDGSPRLQVYNWRSCKIAHMRPDATEGTRPKLGRPSVPPNSPKPTDQPEPTGCVIPPNVNKQQGSPAQEKRAKIQKLLNVDNADTSSERLTRHNTRPQRSSRNPNPAYIDFLALPG